MNLSQRIKAQYRKNRTAFRMLKGNWRFVLVWPALGALLGLILWAHTLIQLETTHEQLLKQADADAHALAEVYAKQVERSVSKIDEVTYMLKWDWERSPDATTLTALHKRGLFRSEDFTAIAILDANGKTVSTVPKIEKPLDFHGHEFFLHHKHNVDDSLRIGDTTVGVITKRRIIPFTRRLEAADGTFSGVLMVSVPLEFFASFTHASILGESGILAIIGDDKKVRVTGVGGEVGRWNQVFLKDIPKFDSNKSSTVQHLSKRLGGGWFSDNQTRFAASVRLSKYPMRTFVALSGEEALAPYWKSRREIIRGRILTTLVSAFFITVAMYLSARLVVRRVAEAESRKAYRLATEVGNEAFFLWRIQRNDAHEIVDFKVVDCNERGAEMFGLHKERLLNQTIGSLYPETYAQKLIQTHRQAFEKGFYEDEFEVPAESRISCDWIHRKMVRTREGLAITWRDITQLRNNKAELERLALEDGLTSLPNRYWMTKKLPLMLEAAEQQNSELALMFIDLDDFKYVNDTLGHSAGDALLRSAAERLRALVRPTDHVVRLGGDEFTVILDPIMGTEQVAQVAARIVQAFKAPFELDQGISFVGTSIGVALFPRHGRTAEALTINADIAMYAAKANKGGYLIYEAVLYEKYKAKLTIETELQQGLANDEFIVHYQPRCNAVTGEVLGFEALVRWSHPTRGLLAPGEFIPAAEETGLILKLGEQVLHKVCAQLRSWRESGEPVVPISVNVSARQFNRADVIGLIRESLEKFQLEPELIELELTESAMMDESPEVVKQLAELSALGIRLHVDDFGTGYSSLALLQRLKLDVLKVDRAFTSQLEKSSESEIFFNAIVSMAHALGMTVIAEGVETAGQLKTLQRLRCDEVQGFYLSKPLSTDKVPALLSRRNLLSVQQRGEPQKQLSLEG